MTAEAPPARNWAAKAIPLLILAGLCAYSNSFTKAFLLDDDPWIVSNGKLASDPLGAIWGTRPVAMATVVANYKLGGLRPFGYHLVNVAAHLAAGLALYGFVRRTLLLPRWAGRFDVAAVPISLTAALLWLLHPIQTQSVTYVIQRCESMMGLFFILGFYTFARSLTATRPAGWLAATALAFALSAGCKETAVVFPPLVLLYDRAFGAGTLLGAVRRRKWFYLALGLVWAGHLWVVLGSAFKGILTDRPEGADVAVGFAAQSATPYQYLLTQAGVIVHYLRLSVWPTDLCFDYRGWPIANSPADVAWQLAVVVGLLAAALWAAVRRPAAGFVGLWFFATLAPTSSVMPILDVAFEQRMYLPLAALTVLAAIGGAILHERRAAQSERPQLLRLSAVLVVGFVAVVFTIRTMARNETYRTPVVMWEDTARKNPFGFRPQANLAQALIVAGRNEEAVRASERAIEIDPAARMAYVNKGAALINLNKLDEGRAALLEAIEVNKGGFPVADTNLGWCYVWASQFPQAEFHFRYAVVGQPDRADYRYNHALVLFLLGRDAEAQAQADEGRRLNPGWAAARSQINRTVALADDPRPHDLRSVRLLQEMICRLDGDRTVGYLDTLAFAYAAEARLADLDAANRRGVAGLAWRQVRDWRYDAAAAATRRALRAAEASSDREWGKVLRERLAAYEARRPVRPLPAKKS